MSMRRWREESRKDRTKQSFKDECDINNITKQFMRTGMVAHLSKGVPSFADVSDAGDLRTLLDRVAAATEWFGRLPAKVREAFQNDPAVFIDTANSPDRDRVFRELGIVDPVVEAPPAEPAGGAGTV